MTMNKTLSLSARSKPVRGRVSTSAFVTYISESGSRPARCYHNHNSITQTDGLSFDLVSIVNREWCAFQVGDMIHLPRNNHLARSPREK